MSAPHFLSIYCATVLTCSIGRAKRREERQSVTEEMAILSMFDCYTGVLLAFWDGLSRGTKHMIDLAEKHKAKVYIIKIKA